MNYEAKANVISDIVTVKKSQRITEELYKKLPERLKNKFRPRNQEVNEEASKFNQIIGDTPEEKKKREDNLKEDEAAEAKKKADAELKAKAQAFTTQTKKKVEELGNKLSEEEKAKLSAEFSATEAAIATDDVVKIKAAADKLSVLFNEIQKKFGVGSSVNEETKKEDGIKQPPARQK